MASGPSNFTDGGSQGSDLAAGGIDPTANSLSTSIGLQLNWQTDSSGYIHFKVTGESQIFETGHVTDDVISSYYRVGRDRV